MKEFEFTREGINSIYEEVCDESMNKIFEVMHEINNTHDVITEEQNKRFDSIYDSIAIKITIGNSTITIPNNADNVESIFSSINECLEQTEL